MRTTLKEPEEAPVAESKVYPDAAAALKGLTFDGMTVMSGGFGLSGNPENLIAALKGNLVYRKTARNFNPVMATAGKVTIAEVEELVEPGQLDADTIHTPGIFVQRIVQGRDYKKLIERVTTRPRPTTGGV
jgi:acyl CoA:acetate/3-ketoacid CoA transferase alpha subunit